MLWSKNYQTAMAISVAQVNVIRTGKDQLKNVLGYLNSRNTDWEIPFRSVIQLDNLNCSYLHHAQVFCVSICIKSLYIGTKKYFIMHAIIPYWPRQALNSPLKCKQFFIMWTTRSHLFPCIEI